MPELKENEKIFTIPLRKAYEKSSGKRAPYATRLIREFLQKNTKAKDVKIGVKLNEAIWERGITRPPRKIRVKTVIEEGIIKAELVGFEYREFKASPKKEKKGAKEKLMERLGPKAIKKEEEEKKIEGKEDKIEEEIKPKESIEKKTTEKAAEK